MSQATAPHAHILLTGATGFVGKVVLAELLRRRVELGVARIYVVIRTKRGKTPGDRFMGEIASSPLFRRFPADWTDCVVPVAGELTQPHCGLAEADVAMLRANVTQIIHCAASVEFDLPIADAAASNITSALHVLELAGGCGHLERMVSVSTAYVTPWRENQGLVPEALVELPFDAADTYAAIQEGRADEAALMKASGHPNTYTLTKCLAEHMLVARRGGVPLSIVRPSIVSATLQHPEPAWLDSAAAFAGFVALVGAGRMHLIVGQRDAEIDIVPCDTVAEVILAEALRQGDEGAPRIRHAVAGPGRNVTVAECTDVVVDFFKRLPHDRPAVVHRVGPMDKSFERLEWRHHTMPLAVGAALLKLAGKPDQARQASRLAAKLRQINRAFPYFTQHSYQFASEKPAAMPGFEPRSYIERVCEGVSRQLLKKDPSAVSLAGRAHKDAHRSDLGWAMGRPHGNAAIRAFGWVIRKGTRAITESITFDHTAFARARASVPAEVPIVLVPTHRSYMDFLICSYLFFARPDLGIRIPYIAAAEEFSAIPVLGKLFNMAQAFYLRRGLQREDPELTRTVHALFNRGEVIEFFIEGARSRSRQYLQPRTGLLRALQATGRPFAVLPVAITYDRVPEEATLARELAGDAKPRMGLGGLWGWAGRMRRGEVALGRIHIGCAAPVHVSPEDEVHGVARRIMQGLQGETAVSTHHLRCFLAHAAPAGVDAAWLKAALERRGATVIESGLGGEEAIDRTSELSMRSQWLHWFYEDARARWPEHPVLANEAATKSWVTPRPGASEGDDPRLAALLEALFVPLMREAASVIDRIGEPEWAPRAGTPAAILPDAPGVFLLHAQAAFDCLVAHGVLEREAGGKSHRWGARAEALADLRRRARQLEPVDGRPVAQPASH